MLRTVKAFVAGLIIGGLAVAAGSASGQNASSKSTVTNVTQLRLYTWQKGVYPLRTRLGYRIPFAAKIPSTNQFLWIVQYTGPDTWEQKEAQYYASAERVALSPDPRVWIARPEQLMVTPVVGPGSTTP
ncbi:MAG: hypothetical protein DMF89_17685 [Acidobacteria bacterium]|nr:MAG: hypothetical protein DMF89_17685 [Acidobacteriota bacterium]